MEYKNQFLLEEGQKQTVYFTIEYSKENPIAVSDLTKALDGLNQMFASYVHSQLNSEESMKLREKVLSRVWKSALAKNGKEWEIELRRKWENEWRFGERERIRRGRLEEEEYDLRSEWVYKQRNKWAEDHLGTFYIEEIKQGSIIGVLSAIVGVVGFVGSIASIVSLFKGEKNETNNNSNNVYKINGDHNTVNNITNTFNIINVIQSPGQCIKIEDAQNGERVEINYHNVRRMNNNLLRSQMFLDRHLYHPYYEFETTTFRKVWIQIERRHSGEYYASILNNPIIQNLRLPIDIRDESFKEDIEQNDRHLNNRVYLVDIDLVHMLPNRMNYLKYVLYSVYDYDNLDYIDRHLGDFLN